MLVRITLNLHVKFGGAKSYIVSFHQKMGYEFSFVQILFMFFNTRHSFNHKGPMILLSNSSQLHIIILLHIKHLKLIFLLTNCKNKK